LLTDPEGGLACLTGVNMNVQPAHPGHRLQPTRRGLFDVGCTGGGVPDALEICVPYLPVFELNVV